MPRLFLAIYPKDPKSMYPRYLNTAMSFATTKLWDQQRCLSADWIRKIWYSHTMKVLKTIYYYFIYYYCITHMYAFIQVCMHMCVCACACVCVYACTYVYTCVRICMCVCVCAHVYVCGMSVLTHGHLVFLWRTEDNSLELTLSLHHGFQESNPGHKS